MMKSKMPVQVIFREYFEGILAAVLLALFLRIFVFTVMYLPETNMEPGLLRGDFVLGWRLAYGLSVPLTDDTVLNPKAPQRGDIISFRFPGNEDQILIRRIIGIPGDSVGIGNGKVSVNEEPLASGSEGHRELLNPGHGSSQDYEIVPDSGVNFGPAKVPEGHYFVLNDNRTSSDDSRSWGFVPRKNIESRLGLIWLSIEANEEQSLRVRWNRLLKRLQ